MIIAVQKPGSSRNLERCMVMRRAIIAVQKPGSSRNGFFLNRIARRIIAVQKPGSSRNCKANATIGHVRFARALWQFSDR